jgi:hypothetical protein
MKPRWSPNWAVILRDLPPATHARVRDAVEAARSAYFAVDDNSAHAEQGRLWREITDYAASRKIQGFCDLVAQLEPDCPEADLLHILVRDLNRVRDKLQARAVLFQHHSRKVQFYTAVLRAWTNARGELGQTADGPTARYLCAVSEGIPPHRLSGNGAKKVIGREKERRRAFELHHGRHRVYREYQGMRPVGSGRSSFAACAGPRPEQCAR